MKKNAKHRVCMYCEKDEEPSDDEVQLPASSGPGIVSKTVAEQRRDKLAGKKGIERMMEARIDDDHLVVFDNDHEQMSQFIDCKFRMWHWKTQAQFKKWAKEMEKIIANDYERYTRESLNTKSKGPRKDALFLKEYRLTKAFLKEEKNTTRWLWVG